MRDVAREASVSIMTVSRVVNGSGNVDALTRRRVESAIERLGYRHNAGASALRRTGAATSTIGLVVDDVANPFCSGLQRGVELACRERGYLVLAGSSDARATEERSLVAAFLGRRVDGLIVMGTDRDQGYLAAEARRGVHTVFADRPAAGLEADCVVTDNVEAAATATRHLLLHGHRRVALLGGRLDAGTTCERWEGYRQAHAQLGVALDPALQVVDLRGREAAVHALGGLLEGAGGVAPPTAVFAAQNLLTVGAVEALHTRGLQHRVALVGFDDVDLAGMLDPPVTLVLQDPERMGREAAAQVLRRAGGDTSPARRTLLQARLVPRGSGEIRPA